jgi:hypothetical protein
MNKLAQRTRLRVRKALGYAAFFLLWASSSAFAQQGIFRSASDQPRSSAISSTTTGGVNALPDRAQRFVAVDTDLMARMHAGDETSVITPGDGVYAVVFERAEVGFGGGTIWIGHLREFGKNYPVLISVYQGFVSGSITTPGGQLRLHGPQERAALTDLSAANEREFTPARDDTLHAPLTGGNQTLSSAALATATAVTPAKIDLLLLFTPSLQTALGGYSAAIARFNALVATANQAYLNSGINISLNLVEAQAVNYAYASQPDDTALPSLQSDPVVAALRNQYGADLVTLLRPFVAANGVCGLGYLPSNFSSSNYGFSVVEDGTDAGFYCDITALTHELGHNMGAAHDVYASVTGGGTVNGTPSYNRGYCNGSAATIMSYTNAAEGCSPLVLYFSNPALTSSCGGASCGVPIGTSYTAQGTTKTVQGADSTTGININAPSIAVWRTAPSKFVPLTPARVVDTRPGFTTSDGLFAGNGALSAAAQLDLAVLGRGGIPNGSVGSVVLNVTAITPSAPGFVTVWPTGSTRPNASNLNFTPGQIVPNLVIAKVGSNGSVSMFNSAGNTDFVADVAGWFPTASGFNALTPARLLDTRAGWPTIDGQFAGGGALTAGAELDLTVAGRGSVPASGAGAVVLNVTVTNPSAAGFVTVWAAGSARPFTSNLNFTPGETIPNLVVATLGANGTVALFNSGGNTDLVADVAGWFATGSEFVSVVPARLLDTRPGYITSDGQFAGGGALAAATQLDLTVTNRAGIPSSGVGAVVLNITAVAPTSAGFLTVWPTGDARPNASNLNFTAGLIIPNLVIAKVGSAGQVSIYNNAGSTNVIADVVGWLQSNP